MRHQVAAVTHKVLRIDGLLMRVRMGVRVGVEMGVERVSSEERLGSLVCRLLLVLPVEEERLV